jgi:hypothetical protein
VAIKGDRQSKRGFPAGMPDLARLGLPPEFLLLLAILRSNSNQEAEAEIHSSSQEHIKWPAFMVLIDRHGVAPLVHTKLRSWDLAFVPDQIRTQIRERYRNNGLHALRLATEFARLSGLFEAGGLQALPLKGFAVAVQAYDDLSARHAGDLDILVSTEQADRAAELLGDEGYVSVDYYGDQTPHRRDKIKQFRNHFVHWNQDKKIRVELHWRFHTSRLLYPVKFEDLVERSMTITVGDQPIGTMSIEDTLLFILSHGASHAWNHLFWLCDLAGMIERNPGLNWSRLVELAAELNISRPLALGLILSHCLLNTFLPEELFEATKRDPAIHWLLDGSIQAVSKQGPFSASFIGRVQDVLYQLKLSKNLAYKVDQLGSRLLDVDGWNSVPLPDSLFPLYYLLGPFTWLSRSIRKRA